MNPLHNEKRFRPYSLQLCGVDGRICSSAAG
jgi:hypothetical protein